MIRKVIYHAILGDNVERMLDFKKAKETWTEHLPGWKIIRIGDENYRALVANGKIPEFIQKCYDTKLYAIVVDYLRLMVMSQNTGLWLDADVSLVAPIPDSYFDADILLPLEVPNPWVQRYRINLEIMGVTENALGIVKRMFESYNNFLAEWDISDINFGIDTCHFAKYFFDFDQSMLMDLEPVNNICRIEWEGYTINLYYDDKDYEKKECPVFLHDKIPHWNQGTKVNVSYDGSQDV